MTTAEVEGLAGWLAARGAPATAAERAAPAAPDRQEAAR